MPTDLPSGSTFTYAFASYADGSKAVAGESPHASARRVFDRETDDGGGNASARFGSA
jgi:hypothetical protein